MADSTDFCLHLPVLDDSYEILQAAVSARLMRLSNVVIAECKLSQCTGGDRFRHTYPGITTYTPRHNASLPEIATSYHNETPCRTSVDDASIDEQEVQNTSHGLMIRDSTSLLTSSRMTSGSVSCEPRHIHQVNHIAPVLV